MLRDIDDGTMSIGHDRADVAGLTDRPLQETVRDAFA